MRYPGANRLLSDALRLISLTTPPWEPDRMNAVVTLPEKATKCGLSALVLHWNHSSKLNQRQLPASVARSHAVLALARGYSLTDRIAPGDTARLRVGVLTCH